MNITDYCPNNGYRNLNMATASFGRDYKVINADEYFYEFLGSIDEVPITSIIHEDDMKDFCDAVERIDSGPQHIILKMKNRGNVYRFFKIKIELNGRMIDGFKSYDISFMDIHAIESRFAELDYNVKKYRKFMAIMNEFYFEYDLKSRIFKIYSYINEKSNLIVRQPFEVFCNDMLEHYLPDKKALSHFLTFRSYLEDGVDNFQVQFASTYLSKASRIDVLIFQGCAFYYKDEKSLVVGTMKSVNIRQIEKAYYLTDAAKDSATGLFNKRATMEYVSDRIKASESKNIGIIIIDIDNFKNINDTFGHLFGDEVISKVSDVIKSVVSSRGVVGRFGGDEFMIIMENYGSKESIGIMLETIARHLAWMYRGINDDIMITASIGVSCFPYDGKTYEELFMKADKALYIAKENGKDGYVIYDERLHGNVDIAHDASMRRHKIDADWAYTISESILELHKYGVSSIPGILKRICDVTDISGVTIYTGVNLKRTYTEGAYRSNIDSFMECASAKYFGEFNDNNAFIMKNAEKLGSNFERLYKAYDAQDTKAFLQCVSYLDNRPFVLISFDVFMHTYNWSAEEANILIILAKMIGQVLVESASE